jgi:autotransporter-associated beta strand protein
VNITDGGVVTCSKIIVNGNTSGGTAAITIDGGTLRASESNTAFIPNKDNLTVTVGASGGTLDANGKDITIARTISGTGGMTFKGGGTVRLSAAPSYAGRTAVEIGTTVHVTSQSDIAGNYDIVVPATPPADGVYSVFTIDGAGTFTSSVLDGVANPSGGTLRLSNDSKSILCVYGTPGFVWIGGATGSLSEATNWLNGVVPTSGCSCTIGSPAAANLALGDTFAPSSITFPTNSALITITGERTLSGLSSIVNGTSQHHVFACPIDARAATPALPLAEANYLVFSGGIALTSMPSVNDMRLAGVWNLTGVWDEPPPGTSIMSGSTVNVSGLLDDGYNIVIQQNTTLNAAEVKAPHGDSPKNRFLYKNAGTFNVTGEMLDTIASGGSTAYSLAGAFAKGDSKAVTRTKGLVHSGSTKSNHQFILNNTEDSVTNTFVLGSGGLSFRNNLRSNSACYPYFQIDSGKAATLASSADWSFGANPVSGKDLSLELGGTVFVDTSDYDDRTVPHTIHVLNRIGSSGNVTVKGCGKLVFEHYSDFWGTLTVQDTATVAVNHGCGFSRGGKTTVNSGATIEVVQSGSLSFGRDLTLADGAILGFNFTEKAPPVLNLSDKTVTLGSQKNIIVKITAAEGKRAHGGVNVLTAGGKFAGANVTLAEGAPKWAKGVRVENNEIVLDVISVGTYIIVR